MSALAGILNFGSGVAPVNEDDLARLGAALDARGPDGGFDVVSGNLGMSYRAFHTNRESRLEAQPLVSREGHLLTWNGRLDNRDDLNQATALKPPAHEHNYRPGDRDGGVSQVGKRLLQPLGRRLLSRPLGSATPSSLSRPRCSRHASAQISRR